ncbi:MAG TPA: pyridoxal-dependent decarboxylase, partial [Chloroflexota bacterium]|nr:pyridoxal-dependent decarboxylase [Chloroflexota bacterium]
MDSLPASNRNESASLDFAPEEFEELLREASAIVARLYANLDSKPVYQGKSPFEVKALFDEPLPRSGTDIHQLLQQVERDVFGPATLSISPSFFGYIMSGGNQAGILGDMLATAIDQNGGKWN